MLWTDKSRLDRVDVPFYVDLKHRCAGCIDFYHLSRVMRKPIFAYAKANAHFNNAVTAQLIIAFFQFATYLIDSTISLPLKSEISSL